MGTPHVFKGQQRHFYMDSPLGPDVLLLRGFSGSEGISRLFEFRLDCLANNTSTIDFHALLGQKVSWGIQGETTRTEPRHFNGTVVEVSQGSRDRRFTAYDLTIVPDIWRLTRKHQSRIFQHITIPDVLKKVLTGFDVAYEIQGTWEQREFCVQYRETDFEFISRLMEEEGIFYFFKYTRGSHKMVVANAASSHVDVPINSQLIFEGVAGGLRDEERISTWEKTQDFSSGKYTLFDHHFQLPHKHLEAEQIIVDTVPVGKVAHKLKLGGNESLEVYDYPGAYAQRFDGIDKAGGEKPADLQKIFQDNKRTVSLRMQETEQVLETHGTSNCRQLTPGHKFTLQRHFNADGAYVLTSVSHQGFESHFASSTDAPEETHYSNTFACIPLALPYRPARHTPCPKITGSQTAVVVGPAGEEIFTDKYGRIKVQFHWDREGKNDVDSSCWVRVVTPWAGKNWGHIYIPRIGQEVVITFLEGHPDRPLCTGSVYNPDQMPPYELPLHKTVSTIRSKSTKGGAHTNFNEIRTEDLKDKEQLFIHAERDKDQRTKKESREFVGQNRHMIIAQSHNESVGGDRHTTIGQDLIEEVGKDHKEQIKGSRHSKVVSDHQQQTGGRYAYQAGTEIHIQAGMKVIIEAGVQITLKGPGGFVDINPMGVVIQGTMVLINSGGAAGSGSGSHPDVPKPAAPDKADDGTKFDKM